METGAIRPSRSQEKQGMYIYSSTRNPTEKINLPKSKTKIDSGKL